MRQSAEVWDEILQREKKHYLRLREQGLTHQDAYRQAQILVGGYVRHEPTELKS